MSGLTRSQLIGKQVYNPDGTLVGTINDVELIIDRNEVALQVQTKYRTVEYIPWTRVNAVGDIVLLKEKVEIQAPQAPPLEVPKPVSQTVTEKLGGIGESIKSLVKPSNVKCPSCGEKATYIPQYKRYYCYKCAKYID
ncbi:MAG: PRC-barrel domain-containing protein [Nitrososphaerota archaeon]|nr:PRC-barrel domain-containing protein [Aigarchaeota archaeon]MDW8077002.1 PRC-barrel domain-containing protein [Nitrososphaerota archaeon]